MGRPTEMSWMAAEAICILTWDQFTLSGECLFAVLALR